MHKLWLLASTAGKGLLQCVLIVALTFLFCRTIPGDAVVASFRPIRIGHAP